MILPIVLVVIAFVSLGIILGIAVSRSLRISKAEAGVIEVIDVKAFRNLVDPAEDDYLRSRLSPPEFRRVQRARLRASSAYVQAAGRNAAHLVRLGQIALASSSPNTAEAARKLIDQALLLRRNATFALLRIHVAMVWPNSILPAAPVLSGYERLTGSAMLLGRLQNPATPVRISAT